MSMSLMTSKVAQETITGSAWTVPFRGAEYICDFLFANFN